MKNKIPYLITLITAAGLLSGCQSPDKTFHGASAEAAAPTSAAAAAPALAAPAKGAPVAFPIRIKAGLETPVTDSMGNVWQADHGFADGEVMDRGNELVIANTKEPALYRAERYSMTAFSLPVPNGKYTVKLHFCETYEGIEGPGQRVFSFNVEGHEFKDFDIWVKAGGPFKAYVETVNVEVKDGKLDIQFIPNVENPAIDAIEIIQAS